MAYDPTTWQDGDIITAEKMNKLEQGVQNEQTGPAGPAGKDGKYPTAIKLTTDDSGKVTGGTVTMSDKTSFAITVEQAEA